MKFRSYNYINLLWITFVLLYEKQVANGDNCGCYNATMGTTDYMFCPCKKTQEEAEEYCRASRPGGELAAIQNGEIQNFLANELKKSLFGDTWVGATNVRSDWHWAAGKQYLKSLGCYDLQDVEHDITNEVFVNDLTPEGCMQSCKLFEYHYAAVTAGRRCFCGHTLVKPKFTQECNSPCVGDINKVCGGQKDYSIYNLNGSYTGQLGPSSVGPLQPPDTAECIQLTCDYTAEGEVWSWVPSACKKKNTHLCEKRVTQEESCEGHTKIQVNDSCILVEELMNRNWYEARWQCIENGGDLLIISDEAFEKAVKDSLECWQSPLWIGGTRTAWMWQSDEMMLYSAWAVQNPSGVTDRCVAMSITLSSDYEWTDLDCNQFLSFICQRTEVPTTIPPTTTTTTTTTVTTRQQGDGGANTPANEDKGSTLKNDGGSTRNTVIDDGSEKDSGGSDKWKWVYVAVGVIGGLCVILGIGVYLIERTKVGREKCEGLRRCNCLRRSTKYEEDLPNGEIRQNGLKKQENGHAGGTNVVLNMHKTNHDTTPNGYYKKT